MSTWQFAWPWLLLAWPLPWLTLLHRQRAQRRRPSATDAALRVPFGGALRTLSALQVGQAGWRRWPWLALLGWSLLCVAAARPQQVGEIVQPPQSGRDLLLAVDLSGSMAEQDMVLGGRRVDRLTAVKAVVGDFLERRTGDRVGLLLFGQKAYAVTPLTPDRNAVRAQLMDSAVGIAGQETAIGDALGLGVKRLEGLDGVKDDQKVLILLTDGVNTAGTLQPDKATELARLAGVRVHTIGFGGQGAPGLLGMRRGAQIDERTLAHIAAQTGGQYFRAQDTAELARIYAELDRIEPVAREGITLRPTTERYVWPLAAAVGVGVLGLLWTALGGLGVRRTA